MYVADEVRQIAEHFRVVLVRACAFLQSRNRPLDARDGVLFRRLHVRIDGHAVEDRIIGVVPDAQIIVRGVRLDVVHPDGDRHAVVILAAEADRFRERINLRFRRRV